MYACTRSAVLTVCSEMIALLFGLSIDNLTFNSSSSTLFRLRAPASFESSKRTGWRTWTSLMVEEKKGQNKKRLQKKRHWGQGWQQSNQVFNYWPSKELLTKWRHSSRWSARNNSLRASVEYELPCRLSGKSVCTWLMGRPTTVGDFRHIRDFPGSGW